MGSGANQGGGSGRRPPPPKPPPLPPAAEKERRAAKGEVEDDRRRADRRREPRVPVELWVEAAAGDELYFQRMANLSVGGAFFAHTVPHEVGTIVQLRFELPGDPEPLACKGEIVSARDEAGEPGMGVRFLELRPADRLRLEQLVEKLEKLGKR